MHKFVSSKRGKTGRTALSLAEEIAIYRQVKAKQRSRKEIADDLGIHRNTVANICDRISALDERGELPPALDSAGAAQRDAGASSTPPHCTPSEGRL